MKISNTIKVGLYLSKLILNLILIWLTSTWGVRKARKAFKKELVRSGMPKEAAKKLAKKYPLVKDIVHACMQRKNHKTIPRSCYWNMLKNKKKP